MIRAGFVGAGFAARFHYESLEQVRSLGIQPVGVYSQRPESRESFARQRSLKAFDSIEALLDAVDVVHVCVPPAFHAPVSIAALQKGVHVIVEKPFTGYFGPPGDEGFRAQNASRETMRTEALASARRMLEAEAASAKRERSSAKRAGSAPQGERSSAKHAGSAPQGERSAAKGARIFYAENWIFAPVIQKEAEIIRKTGAQILWIVAEESHSGSHSPTYGIWRFSGGGSLMGKGCHPLTAALYLKRLEGQTRSGKPIRPQSVSARTHDITRLPGYEDKGYLRTDYADVEDFGLMHVVFEDGTIADIFSSEIALGGVHNWLEVMANNHRSRCNINPIDAVETYNPSEAQFKDIYVVEKIGTKQGWSKPAPDENWMNGYVQEMASFYRSIQNGEAPFAGSELGYDTVAVIYAAYLSAERKGAEITV